MVAFAAILPVAHTDVAEATGEEAVAWDEPFVEAHLFRSGVKVEWKAADPWRGRKIGIGSLFVGSEHYEHVA